MKKFSTLGLALAVIQVAPIMGLGAQSWAGARDGDNEDRRPIIHGMIQVSEFHADDLGVKGKLIDARKDILKDLYEDKALAKDKIITLSELKDRDRSDADQIAKLETQLIRLQEDYDQEQVLNQKLKADYEAQKADRERIERELKANKGANEDGKKTEIKLAKEEENRRKDTFKASEDRLKNLQKSHESAGKVVIQLKAERGVLAYLIVDQPLVRYVTQGLTDLNKAAGGRAGVLNELIEESRQAGRMNKNIAEPVGTYTNEQTDGSGAAR